MKYSLRSLMILAAVAPAILAVIFFSLRELFRLVTVIGFVSSYSQGPGVYIPAPPVPTLGPEKGTF
jgi:hypothetical protein